MARTILARAPARLDFGGGWTDVPPYCDTEGGIVCNVAIARWATVRLTDAIPATAAVGPMAVAVRRRLASLIDSRAPEPGFSLTSDFPVGAGLGGSSAAGVATVAALARWHGLSLGREEIAEVSRAAEVDEMGIPGGRQDHYAAAFGGAQELLFSDRTEVRPIPLDDALRAALERRCIVVHTGESRISGRTITAVLDAYRARQPRVTVALARMRTLAAEMASALRQADVDLLGALVGEHWAHQRTLDPAIPTPLIDEVIAAAMQAGALGAKALGASGGGCVLAIAADGRDGEVRAAMTALGEPVEVRIDTTGLEVVEGRESTPVARAR